MVQFSPLSQCQFLKRMGEGGVVGKEKEIGDCDGSEIRQRGRHGDNRWKTLAAVK